MASIPEINPNKRNFKLPEVLRRLDAWLVWRFESAGVDAKPLKVPYYTNDRKRSGKQGSSDDRVKLASYGVALRRMIDRKYDGIGLAMLEDWGLTAIDIDNCVGPNGELPDIVNHLIERTYVEYSPSGNGVRAFVRGNLGNHKSPTKGNDFGLETFHSSGYVTITGKVHPACEVIGTDEKIGDITPELRALCEQRFGALTRPDVDPDDPFIGHEPRLGMSVKDMECDVFKLDPDMSRDQWIRVGMALHHETEGGDTGFHIWDDWSSQGSKYVSQDDLRTQWDSFDRRAGTRRANVTMASVKAMVRELPVDAERLREEVEGIPAPSHALVATPSGYEGKYRVLSSRQMAEQPPLQWIIRGVLPKADIAVLYGPPGSGKSFLLLDLLAAVARGVTWCGERVQKGRVIIVAAEGAGGYGGRLRAYCEAKGISLDDLDIGVISGRPNIMEPEEIGELAKAIKAAGGCDILAIDTLAQVTPGANENSSEDMGLAIANARVLREVAGAMVLFAHHSGKDLSKGMRGSSVLLGAVDAELLCWRDGDRNYRELRVTKQKDGEDGRRWGFKLDVVDLGLDHEGDKITSCVVTYTDVQKSEDAPGGAKGAKRRGKWQRHILEIVETLDPGVSRMPLAKFIELAVDAVPEEVRTAHPRYVEGISRAVRDVARERDAPLGIDNFTVVFYE